MRQRGRLRTAAVTGLVLAALAAGGLLGVRLGRVASTPAARHIAVSAPEAFAGPPADVARSAGGFTGFGGRPALGGEVLRSGTVETTGGGTILIAGAESTLSLRATSSERLYGILPATAPLRAGDLVQVYARDGAAVAVLRLPPGLGQGGNR